MFTVKPIKPPPGALDPRKYKRALDWLEHDKPSNVTAPWHQWRVTLTTTSLGLLTMQVR